LLCILTVFRSYKDVYSIQTEDKRPSVNCIYRVV